MTRGRLLRAALVATLALLAFGLVFETGTKGFLAFDQSIVFDGGYRVFLGQVPFRDFFAPTGPVPFWIQGAFFRLGSVGYPAYLLHAAVANAVAAALAFLWMRGLFPETTLYAFIGGLLTAIWFYPPFGTPWLEQTAFLFHLVAMVSLSKAHRGTGAGAGVCAAWAAAAGVATVLAFLSKQNAGLLTLFMVALVVCVLERAERVRVFRGVLMGLAGATASFAVWLFVRSHPGHFWTFFVEIPSAVGASRLSGAFFSDLVLEELSLADPVRATSVLALAVAAGALAGGSPSKRVAAVSIVSLFLYQSLFVHVTNNEPENGFAFAGLIAAMGIALARSLAGASIVPRTALAALAVVVTVALGRYGWDISRSRYVHDVFFRSGFDDAVVSKALAPVRWAQPTPAARRSSETIEVEDVDALTRFLREQPESFFAFPDYTILYGLTGKTPPQPLLWFHPGLTYSRDVTPWLDAWVVRELNEHRVQLVVLEKASWQGTERRLSDFPALARFVTGAFELDREFGNFTVLRRRE